MRERLKTLPLIRTVIRSRPYLNFRHWYARHFQYRGHYTLTRFCRLPEQYQILTDIVIPDLMRKSVEPIHLVSLGCSNGAEPYSIASTLMREFPKLGFSISAYDIDSGVLDVARAGVYSAEEIALNNHLSSDFLDSTFRRSGESYTVKEEIRRRTIFSEADVLDASILERIDSCDVLFAQNLFNNLEPRIAKSGFTRIKNLLKPGGYLFVDGMDLGQRARLTRKAGLEPVTENIEEIHSRARSMLMTWPWHYSGLEPMSTSGKEWQRRYATVFRNRRAGQPGPRD